jgi:hypothetical protein
MSSRTAVVIGINYSSSASNATAEVRARAGAAPLRFAENDAIEVSEALKREGYDVTRLLGSDATREAIIQALRRQRALAGMDGLLVVYFGGHGEVDPQAPGAAYLVPFDANPENLETTGISLDDLPRRHLGEVGSALTLLDCCHSGMAVGVRGKSPEARAREFGRVAEHSFGHYEGRVVLTACAGDQLAREMDHLRHGAFTYFVLKWWREDGGEDDLSLSSYVVRAMEQEQLPPPVRGGTQRGRIVLVKRHTNVTGAGDFARRPDTGRVPEQPAPLPRDPGLIVSPTTQTIVPFERPGGTMSPDSPYYVTRQADTVAVTALSASRTSGVTITIKGARQMGKSSLLARLMRISTDARRHVVYLDFQRFDATALLDSSSFLRQFCSALGHRFRQQDRVSEFWSMPLSDIDRCSAYLEEHLLPAVAGPTVLALDEVDRIYGARFSSDFFGMVRSWHNARATGDAWSGVDLLMATSTEPHLLIGNPAQSPFNVGESIHLDSFSLEQVDELNRRHRDPFTPEDLQRLFVLVGGQPYLVRQALYRVALGLDTVEGLFLAASREDGPFGEHLRHHLFRVCEHSELVDGLLRLVRGEKRIDEQVFYRLLSAGLVVRTGGAVSIRCQLYVTFFGEHLAA